MNRNPRKESASPAGTGRRGGAFALLRPAVLALFALLLAGCAWSEEVNFPNLERSETVLYGAPQSGGLLPRLSRVETEMFGRELPGGLAERQQALLDYLIKGTNEQPSFLFKLGVAEWGLTQRIYLDRPAAARVENLEQVMSGKAEQGPLSMRVEKILERLLGGPVKSTTLALPPSTVVRTKLLQNLTVRSVRKGDPVQLDTAEDLVLNGYLVAPKGSRVHARVADVKGPRSFGRSTEISVTFEDLVPLGQETVPVFIGEAAKKAADLDKSLAGAAGASALGMVLLGPVGLAGGFLVRGDDNPIPAGTLFYVETTTQTPVQAFEIPPALKGLIPTPAPTLAPVPPTPTPAPSRK
jgi:hypothetical protein